jgi:ribosome-associated protein
MRLCSLHIHRIRGGNSIESIELARRIADIISDKKGEDIVLLDIHELSPVADYFVICSAASGRQIKAIVEAVIQSVKQLYQTIPWYVEGEAESGWVLVDYGDVVVHAFAPETRAYYDLEGLWHRASVLLKMT